MDLKHIPKVFMTCLLLANLLFFHINASDEEVEDEHGFSYDEETPEGPENWGTLNSAWQTCKTGKLQSPINLLDNKVDVQSSFGDLKRTYKPAPAVMKNRGHDIMVSWKGDAGGVIINGTEFKLRQCHWHTPSEHILKGKTLNMELHMVHINSRGQIAVVAILYKFGRPDRFLGKLLESVKSITEKASEKGLELGMVNPWNVQFGSRKYYRYMGSLTSPPCTEGVIWTVLGKVRTVSREQSRALRHAVQDGFEDNARPTQPRGGRPVYVYRPSKSL